MWLLTRRITRSVLECGTSLGRSSAFVGVSTPSIIPRLPEATALQPHKIHRHLDSPPLRRKRSFVPRSALRNASRNVSMPHGFSKSWTPMKLDGFARVGAGCGFVSRSVSTFSRHPKSLNSDDTGPLCSRRQTLATTQNFTPRNHPRFSACPS